MLSKGSVRCYSTSIPKIVRVPNVYNPVNSASNVRLPKLQPGLVYHPAPSAPSIKQTPNAFLPENDPRKVSHSVYTQDQIDHMPPLSEPTEKKYHLNAAQAQKIQRLRTENPEYWTKKRLAAKFKCSELFVSLCSKPAESRLEEMNNRLKLIKESWKPTTKIARMDKAKRRTYWLRDE